MDGRPLALGKGNAIKNWDDDERNTAPKAKPSTQASQKALTTGSGAPEAGARTLEDAIGAQVRDFRKAAGLTVSELGAAAEISTAMVSKIENGQISASLSVLHQLAAALNLPLSMLPRFFEGRRGCSFVKKGKGPIIKRRGTKVGHEYQQLGQSVSGTIAFEPYLITLSKDAEPYTQFRHEGLELIYMLSGEVTYLHGETSYRMEPGDCLLFNQPSFMVRKLSPSCRRRTSPLSSIREDSASHFIATHKIKISFVITSSLYGFAYFFCPQQGA